MDKLPWIYLLAALVLVYLPRMVVAREMAKLPGGYDNANPREQQAQLQGLGKRATAAHLNGFEAFPPFAAGILASVVSHVDPLWIAIAGGVFVVARTLYVFMYLGDKASARSGVWSLGFFATCALLAMPLLR